MECVYPFTNENVTSYSIFVYFVPSVGNISLTNKNAVVSLRKGR